MNTVPVRIAILCTGLLALALAAHAQTQPSVAATTADKPTIFLIGDSTVRNNSNGGLGWGTPFATLFDPVKATVNNSAIAGRSARSFYSEGRWDGPQGVKNQLKEGDFVLMQFGTNDGPGNEQQITNSTNGRPDLAGIGEETTTGPNSGRGRAMETVHTFGWYMDLFVKDTLAKKATPVMLTMVPQLNRDNKPTRRTETFVLWCKQIAAKENIPFIDLNDISALRLEKETDPFTKYFSPPGDRTHSNPDGAMFNAQSVVMGIRAQTGLKLNDYLSDAALKLELADAKDVVVPAAR